MLKLPKIPYTMDKDKQQVVSMGDINYSKMTKDGDVADSSGISGRHFPYITTAKECAKEGLGKNIASATFFRSKWVTVDSEGRLYYGGDLVGQLTKGEKQFAAINTKLVIMPDKKYLDVSEGVELKDLGAMGIATAPTFTENSMQIVQGFEMVGGKVSLSDDKQSLTVTRRVADTGLDNCMILVEEIPDYSSCWNFWFIKALCGGYFKYVEENGIYKVIIRSSSNVPFPESGKDCNKEGYNIYLTYADGSGEWNLIGDIEKKRLSGIDFEYTIYLSLSLSQYNKFAYHDTDEIYLQFYSFASVYFPQDYSEQGVANTRLTFSDEKRCVRIALATGDYCVWVERGTFDGPKFSPGILYGVKINNGGASNTFNNAFPEGEGAFITFELDKKIYKIRGTVVSTSENEFKMSIADSVVEGPISSEGGLSTGDQAVSLMTLSCDADGINLRGVLAPGDVIDLTDYHNAEKTLKIKIDSIDDDGKTLRTAANVLAEAKSLFDGCSVRWERSIPNLNYICGYDNRLYGCSNDDQTIYVSALGDPTNIYAYEGVSTDSYAVAVASEGDFTGCCPYDGGVMFWKEQKLHKLLGSYPAEYALYTYNIDGVQEGSHKSLQNIGEVLFYKGERGIFAFDGSPRLISENFGEKRFKEAVAGNDGECYYISMKDKDGKQHFFSYNTRTDLWVREGDMAIGEFIRTSDGVHMLKDGEIYLYGAKETAADSEWFIQLAPIYESIEGKKSYSRIKMRIELPKGSYMTVAVRCDGGRWAECGKIVGRVAGVVPVMIPINRCDRFELKISGKGPCTIHSILREYYVGGDR